MSSDHFEATFVISIDRDTAWKRLTEHPAGAAGEHKYWLPGFDATATVAEEHDGTRLRVTKDEEPCAGTEIVVTLSDGATGTSITVVQSGFGDWISEHYGMMAVGWRHIVADLETYLFTGVHARRHLRAWGDLGAKVTVAGGGLEVRDVRAGSLADRLGLEAGDLLVVVAGAPVSSYDDLVAVLRVLDHAPPATIDVEFVRAGELATATAASDTRA
jgi:hypothetical protein